MRMAFFGCQKTREESRGDQFVFEAARLGFGGLG
jgi:hypothetical protein